MDIEAAIKSLQAKVMAAQEEFDAAVVFHEVWRPTAFDEDLHKRMGASYATNAFITIRTALRREVLLALNRLWDKDKAHVGLKSIGDTLKDQRVIAGLAAERYRRSGLEWPGVEEQMRADFQVQADTSCRIGRQRL